MNLTIGELCANRYLLVSVSFTMGVFLALRERRLRWQQANR